MKVALLGSGKTGSFVSQLHKNTTLFNSKNTPSIEALQKHDVIISFLPGPAFENYLEILIESKIPVVTGSTGFQWPDHFNDKLLEKKLAWIWSNNFSLGMNLVHQMIVNLKQTSNFFTDYSFHLNEVHHTKKLDAPSGTALMWKNWLKEDVNITSERIDDVVGIHELKLSTANENIYLKHEAKDRKIFAQGALWAANKILKSNIPCGLHNFFNITKQDFFKGD